MSDYRDKNRWSNEQIRRAAQRAREAFGVSRWKLVDIVKCLTSGWVPTIEGRKRLTVEILPDDEMRGNDGLTEFVGDVVRMRFKTSVWQKAMARDGRAIMTLAHELAHAVLCHRDVERARQTSATAESRTLDYISPYESSERMADVFASNFLIEEDLLPEHSNAEQVAEEFGVSVAAALVRLRRRVERRKNDSIKSGFAALLNQIGVENKKNHYRDPEYKNTPDVTINDNINNGNDLRVNNLAFGGCQKCGRGKMIYVGGNKYKCDVGDHLQDGDDFVEFL
jgi:Zn-dependent peptidase ImmA (M78 family)